MLIGGAVDKRLCRGNWPRDLVWASRVRTTWFGRLNQNRWKNTDASVRLWIFRLWRFRLGLVPAMLLAIDLVIDGGGRRGQVRKLRSCGRPSDLAVKCHSPEISSMLLRANGTTGRVKRDDECTRAANAFINNLDCVYCKVLRSNSSSEVPFTAR